MKTFTALLAGAALAAFAAPALAQDAGATAQPPAPAATPAEGDAEAVNVSVGAEVLASDGASLGSVVALGQDTAGTQYVLIEGADGAVRGVQSSLVSTNESGAFTAELTAEGFAALPAQPSEPAAPEATPADASTTNEEAPPAT